MHRKASPAGRVSSSDPAGLAPAARLRFRAELHGPSDPIASGEVCPTTRISRTLNFLSLSFLLVCTWLLRLERFFPHSLYAEASMMEFKSTPTKLQILDRYF